MLLAYLNNPSEEAMFESNRVKKKHETMELQSEEVMLNFKQSLMNSINRPAVRNVSEKNLFVLYIQLVIVYSVLTLTQ